MKSLDYIILLAFKNSRKKEFQSYTTLSECGLKKRKYFITHFYEVSITLILKLDNV